MRIAEVGKRNSPTCAAVAGIISLLALPGICARARAATPGPAPATTSPSEDLDAEQRELERQRQEIDQKLATLGAKRRALAGSQPTSQPVAVQPPVAPEPGTTGANVPRPPEAPVAPESAATAVEKYNVHAQTTVITQEHDVFKSPYVGPNSVPPHEPDKTSVSATLFTGFRLWDGAAAYFDPELSGGEGFAGVKGFGGLPNGEISHVATAAPKVNIARLYYQQVFGLGGEKERVESDQNQLAGFRDAKRFTLTLGKFAASDFFDSNAYAHDARSQFFNTTLVDQGAWDFPADSLGYTEGVVVEYNEPAWAIRYSALAEPHEADGGTLDSHFPEAVGQTLELEKRYLLFNQPGDVRVLGFYNHAHMGKYADAIDEADGGIPDVTKTRVYRAKYGFGVSADQRLTDDLGIFGRAGWNDGRSEQWAFLEVDRSASVGLSLKGTRWRRPDDVFGLALAVNGISEEHRKYLEDGGLGFFIGDGRLNYGLEKILESYYLIKLADHTFVTGDFQLIENPAYNRDRGPVVVGGVRVHIEF